MEKYKEQEEYFKKIFVTHEDFIQSYEELKKNMEEKFNNNSLQNENNMRKLHKDICKDVETSNELQGLRIEKSFDDKIKRVEDLIKEDKIATRDKKLDIVAKVLIGVGTAIIIFIVTSFLQK